MASILNVDKIRATGSTTDALTIDSTGRVKLPAVPAFSATTTGINNQTSGVINYNKELFDIGGNYSTTDKAFTCPVAGVYSFSFSHYTVNGTISRAAIHKNGTLYAYGHRVEGANNECGCTTILMNCAANDVIDIRREEGDVHTNLNYTHFSGHLVG